MKHKEAYITQQKHAHTHNKEKSREDATRLEKQKWTKDLNRYFSRKH